MDEKCKHGELVFMGCGKCAAEACDHAIKAHRPGCDCALCRQADALERATKKRGTGMDNLTMLDIRKARREGRNEVAIIYLTYCHDVRFIDRISKARHK